MAGKIVSPVYALYQFLWASLDWFYPPFCGGCGNFGNRWCPTCQAQIEVLPTKICICCGDIWVNGGICNHCLNNPPFFKGLRSYALFKGPIREAIHNLKYRRDIGLGEALAKHLIDYFNLLNWPIDLIMPVPLSRKRFNERGYNQATLLSRPLALSQQISFRSNALKKVKETTTQVGLPAAGRLQNVLGAFWSDNRLVSGKQVLVIDDVATTGATLNACAKALIDSGARDVYCLTLTRATFQTELMNNP